MSKDSNIYCLPQYAANAWGYSCKQDDKASAFMEFTFT